MRRAEAEDGTQALPFASSYAPPPVSTRPPTSAEPTPAGAAAAAPPASSGVCIIRTLDGQPAVPLDSSIFHQAGMKTRGSSSCIPDLIITMPTLPAPLAVMLVTSADPADSLDSSVFMTRCSSMTSSFRSCCVVLPHLLASHPAVLQLACNARYKSKILLQYMCPGDNPSYSIMQLISCCSNSPEAVQLEADVWNTVVSNATAHEALQPCMAALMAQNAAAAAPVSG